MQINARNNGTIPGKPFYFSYKINTNFLIHPRKFHKIWNYGNNFEKIISLTAASKLPGWTTKDSKMFWIFVMRFNTAACSAAVGVRSWFRFNKAWKTFEKKVNIKQLLDLIGELQQDIFLNAYLTEGFVFWCWLHSGKHCFTLQGKTTTKKVNNIQSEILYTRNRQLYQKPSIELLTRKRQETFRHLYLFIVMTTWSCWAQR